MFSSILVPLDASTLSGQIVPYAEFLARQCRGRLVLLHVTAPRRRAAREAADPSALAATLRERGVAVTSEVARGKPGPEIARVAGAVGADLIAMATHGRGEVGRVLRGSVAEDVLRSGQAPVLLVTPSCLRQWVEGRALRILVPLDGSEFAAQALGLAGELARCLPVELRLIWVVQKRWEIDALGFGRTVPVSPRDLDDARAYLESVAAPLRAAGQDVLVFAEEGDPETWIMRLADDEAIDLVMMATHGRGSLASLVVESVAAVATGGRVQVALGSVATSVVQHAPVPVLLIRPSSPPT